MIVLKVSCLCLYYCVFRYLPSSAYEKLFMWARWSRYVVCKPIFKKCGKKVNVEKGAYFGFGQNIEIDDYSGIGINCRLHGDVKIGKYVMMGPDVVVISNGHRIDDLAMPMMFQGAVPKRQVVIGDDVWIGTRAVILPGVKIGNHSIIGANSVVTKGVPDWAIVAGSPARIIRYRKTEVDSDEV